MFPLLRGIQTKAGQTIQDVANAASLKITGDLLLDWSKTPGLDFRSDQEPIPAVILVRVN